MSAKQAEKLIENPGILVADESPKTREHKRRLDEAAGVLDENRRTSGTRT